MSARKASYQSKDFIKEKEELHNKKNDQYVPDEKARILQDNLVFVNSLPSDTSSKDNLQKELYFGRYGKVAKLILNPPYPNKKGTYYQAYITYSSELDASLAIISLDGYKLSDRPLKVSFGTTKYCSHFIRGNSCPNQECFYLHKIDKKREVTNGDSKIVFKQQNSKAMNIVLQNLEEIIDRVLDSDIEQQQQGFPSLSQLLDYLIDKEYLTQNQVDQAFEDAIKKRKEEDDPPAAFQKRILSQQIVIQNESQEEVKLSKSNSYSTVGSPNKQIKIDKQKQPPKPQKGAQVVVVKQKVQKLLMNIKQNMMSIKQNSRELLIQQKIEKLIIKQILKKGTSDCKSRFIKNATATKEELSKLKSIIQKHLICYN